MQEIGEICKDKQLFCKWGSSDSILHRPGLEVGDGREWSREERRRVKFRKTRSARLWLVSCIPELTMPSKRYDLGPLARTGTTHGNHLAILFSHTRLTEAGCGNMSHVTFYQRSLPARVSAGKLHLYCMPLHLLVVGCSVDPPPKHRLYDSLPALDIRCCSVTGTCHQSIPHPSRMCRRALPSKCVHGTRSSRSH